jgi:hypothetical protein
MSGVGDGWYLSAKDSWEMIPKAKNQDAPDGFLWVKHELKSSHINQVSRTE